MFVAPRPLIEDDPLFAVRLSIMPLIGLVVAMLLRSPMPMVYPAMMFGLMASNRKAFNPGRVFAAPIVFGGTLWLMSGVVELLQSQPLVLVMVMAMIFFSGFYLIQKTGTSSGMLVIVAAMLMSIMGLGSYVSMDYLRSEMTTAALCSAVFIPILYAILPVRTTELHVDDAAPSTNFGWTTRAAIRTVVMLGYAVYLYTILDISNMMLAIAGMYVLVHSTRQSIWREAGQRSFSVVLGGLMALSILWIMTWVGHLVVLMCLMFLATLWLCNKMMTGRLPPMAYQDAASVMISLVGSGLASSEPSFAFIQRAGLTIMGTLFAALVVSILDRLLVRRPQRTDDVHADFAALQNL